ncbi:MAG: ABC transporter transmembrane domain-containing protein [Ruminococcus sp.]
MPETLHNIRTIHCLGREKYMEERYDTYIGESYQAMERTNFYDAVYSPVILILNAVVVAAVMLLSASGNKMVLTFFWNVCGNCSGCDQLYFTDFFAGGKSWNGDSDHPVRGSWNP